MKKILFFLILAGLIAAAVWLGLKKSADEAAASEEGQPTARVETTPLKMQPIAQTLEEFGVVAAAPAGDQVITAMFDGVVRKVIAGSGARVVAGDVLLEIAPNPETQGQLDSARGTLELATKSLAGAQERYDLKIANHQELLAAQQVELDARQKLASLENRGVGGDGKIISPLTGVVGKLDVAAGSVVPAGTALMTIEADAGLEVRLGVEVSDADQVKAGQPVLLHSSHRTLSEPVTATVRLVGGSVDGVTGFVEVRVPVPAGAPLLFGEHVRAAIELQRKTALVAPRRAVLPDNDKNVLYLVKAGRAVRHEITLGIVAGDLVEVSGPDLHDGDSVVTLGNYELADGMAVQLAAAKVEATEAKP